ncbi:MAG: efflux RND transporter periplasmic adaptor subunit [Candidatus Omnitrophica bacterium]|nr:efflux RND transporter periplasmic adaptor subunit [Candidatus Omnitrophota bacterium]
MNTLRKRIPFLLPLLFIGLMWAGLSGCGSKEEAGKSYHCPMHPTYISDRPGDCPICGMRLVPIETKTAPTVAPKYVCPMHPEITSDQPDDRCSLCGMKLVPAGRAKQPITEPLYTCPMHPEVLLHDPNARCPKCGMKLTEVKPATPTPAAVEPALPDPGLQPPMPTATPAAGHEHSGNASAMPQSTGEAARASERRILFYRSPMDPAVTSPVPAQDSMGMDFIPVYADEMAQTAPAGAPAGVPGELAPVHLTEESLRLAGVQIVEATLGKLRYTTRTVGAVLADETRVRHVHTKIAGFVEKLYANFTGQAVRKGDPILSLYSPELLSTQEEFLRALELHKRFRDSRIPEVRKGGDDLLAAARRRLELFDVPADFIANLTRTGKPQRTVVLNAPVSGFVTSKDIYEGHRVEPGMELFVITDLSHVWVEADFYEYEARAVRVGQEATLTFPYDPDLELKGRVAYIYPYLNPESRTLKVRLDFANPALALKPSMYADVTLQIDTAEAVVVPDSAVMDTGLRQVVFVQEADGRLLPRGVKVGLRGNGQAQILSGVRPGEKVVVKANFLIDSESRLRAAIQGMSGGM